MGSEYHNDISAPAFSRHYVHTDTVPAPAIRSGLELGDLRKRSVDAMQASSDETVLGFIRSRREGSNWEVYDVHKERETEIIPMKD